MNKKEFYEALNRNREYALEHHGIKGQKWGIRRFQNPDGSYTEAGLRRYGRALNRESKKGGYRREQDLPAKTLPKGLKVYRTSAGDGDVSGSSAVYITTNIPDARRVRGIADWMAEKSGKSIGDYSEKEYRLTEDLKVPSMKEMREVQEKLFSDSKLRDKIIGEYTSSFQTPEVQDLLRNGKKSQYYKALADELPEDVKAKLYENEKLRSTRLSDIQAEFNSEKAENAQKIVDALKNKKITELDAPDALAAKTILDFGIGSSDAYKDAMIAELSKRGYNAMYDNGMMRAGSNQTIPMYESNGYNLVVTNRASQEAYEPIIAFKGSSLSRTGKAPTKLDNYEVYARREYDIGAMRKRSQKDKERWEKVQNDPVAYRKQKRRDDIKENVSAAVASTVVVATSVLPMAALALII